MLDLVKRAIFASVGAAMMTEEKLRELVAELVKKGELNEKEGEGFLRDLIAKAEKARTNLDEKIQEHVEKTLSTLNIATQKDVLNLKRKIKKLEDDLEALKEEKKNQS